MQKKNAKQKPTRKNSKPNNKAIVNSSTTGAAPLQANFNSISCMQQISQLRAQINAFAAVASMPTLTLPAAYNGSKP